MLEGFFNLSLFFSSGASFFSPFLKILSQNDFIKERTLFFSSFLVLDSDDRLTKNRLIFCPLEKLQIFNPVTLQQEIVEIDDQLDKKYKHYQIWFQ